MLSQVREDEESNHSLGWTDLGFRGVFLMPQQCRTGLFFTGCPRISEN